MCRDTYPETSLPELFDICLARAKERWRSFSTGGSEAENEGIHRVKPGGYLGPLCHYLLHNQLSLAEVVVSANL